jgi:GDP-6-deoxy-D-talose 4-dehydrogenase
MSKILVTGIAGFTGFYVSQTLRARGHNVVGLAHEPLAPDHRGEIHVADLCDRGALESVIAKVQPDRVVHLAATAFVAHSDVEAFYKTNLIGTLNLLEALADTKKPVDRVLLASSANIYGNQKSGMLTEETSPEPSNHYGISKLAMEHVARIMANKLPIIITRPFNYTGVGQAPHFVIPKIVDHARRGIAAIELGNIDVSRDFSDVRWIAECYAYLLEKPEAIGVTFNICSGRSYKLRDVITMIEEIAGIRFEIAENPAFMRSDEIMELYGDRSRLDSVVGPIEAPHLRDTLRWMLEV